MLNPTTFVTFSVSFESYEIPSNSLYSYTQCPQKGCRAQKLIMKNVGRDVIHDYGLCDIRMRPGHVKDYHYLFDIHMNF